MVAIVLRIARRSYEEYTSGGRPGDSSLLEVEDGLTLNQRSRSSSRRSTWGGLDCLTQHLWHHLSTLYLLWFVVFVIACCAMSQANKNKQKISNLSSSSSSSSTKTSGGHASMWADRCSRYGNRLYGSPVIEWDGHHYQIIGGNWAKITWREAEQDSWGRCYQGSPGYLASINSEAENKFLMSSLIAANGFEYGDVAWIGGNDMTSEGKFEWVDGYAESEVFWDGPQSGTYANWALNEPNQNGEEDCVAFNDKGEWNDDNCYKEHNFFFVEFDP